MGRKVRIGIIGCGGIANGKHMPALKKIEEAEMVAFCDIIEERAVKAAKEFGVEGAKVYTDYSADEMVKNKTTNDWRVHNGIDFGGAQGNDVIAIQNGRVAKVYSDPLWGNVVEIDHGKGLVARYCGLSDKNLPKAGDEVEQFDHIGTLDTVPVEAADGAHLHFTVAINGKTVDPLEAMNKLGQGDSQKTETTSGE